MKGRIYFYADEKRERVTQSMFLKKKDETEHVFAWFRETGNVRPQSLATFPVRNVKFSQAMNSVEQSAGALLFKVKLCT